MAGSRPDSIFLFLHGIKYSGGFPARILNEVCNTLMLHDLDRWPNNFRFMNYINSGVIDGSCGNKFSVF